MFYNYIFEGYHFDDMIKCNPCIVKANNVYEAWNTFKNSIAEWYIYTILEY